MSSGFCSDLLAWTKFSVKNPSPKIVMGWDQWAIRSQHHIATALIRPRRMILNGLEGTDLVSWLPMSSGFCSDLLHWKRINDSNPDSNPIFQITIALLSQRNYYRITIGLYISHGNWYGIAIGLLSSIYVTYVKIGLLSDYNSFFDLT